MTNRHVIYPDLIQLKKEVFIINENTKIKLSLKLDEERIINTFKKY